MQNTLGNNEYGLFFTFYSFCMLFQIVLDPGILNYNNQNVSKNQDNIIEIFSEVFGAKLLLALMFLISISVVGLLFGYTQNHFLIFIGVGIIFILTSFMVYLRSHFSALGHYKKESYFSALDKLLMILLIGYFLYVKDVMTLEVFILCQISSLLATCLFFLFNLKKLFKPKLTISFSKTGELIKKTLPFAMVLLLMSVYTRTDSIMLERLVNDDAYSVGVYATGFRLLDAANMVGILFAMMMLPMFSKLVEQKEGLNRLVKSITRLLFFISTLIMVLSFFYSREIMDFIYTDLINEQYQLFQILMIAFWFMTMANIYGCLFLAHEKLNRLNLLFAIGIVINITLNFILIPKNLSIGAAQATLITQIFVFIGQLVLAKATFRLESNVNEYLKMLAVAGLILAFTIAFKIYIPLNWTIQIALISFLAFVLSFLGGFLRLPFKEAEMKQ